MSCGTETSAMRRQIGAWVAPIASSSAGLRFQVAIVERRAIVCSSGKRELTTVELTFWLPGLDQERARDHRTEQDDAGGDRGEHAVETEAQAVDGEPAAGRRHYHAGDAGEEWRLHPASALACEA